MNSNQEPSTADVFSPAPSISHHFSEILVGTTMEHAPQSSEGTQPPLETPHRPGTPPITGARFSRDFAGSRYADIDVTDRRQKLNDAASSHLRTAHLRALLESADLEMQIAEAQERAAAAQERAALARKNTKLLDVESLSLDRRGGRSPASSPPSPPLVARLPTTFDAPTMGTPAPLA